MATDARLATNPESIRGDAGPGSETGSATIEAQSRRFP